LRLSECWNSAQTKRERDLEGNESSSNLAPVAKWVAFHCGLSGSGAGMISALQPVVNESPDPPAPARSVESFRSAKGST
jgi:hypothetical protein